MNLVKYPFREETDTGMIVRLMEECSEVIQIASKCYRFGFKYVYMNNGTNLEKLISEMNDVKLCIKEIERRMQT